MSTMLFIYIKISMDEFSLYQALASSYVISVGGFKVDFCDNNNCI